MTSVKRDSRSRYVLDMDRPDQHRENRDPSPAKNAGSGFQKKLRSGCKKRLLRGHADCAVKADRLTVKHVVFNDVLGQRGELRWLAEANGERHLLSKRGLRSFRQASEQWRVKDDWSNGAE